MPPKRTYIVADGFTEQGEKVVRNTTTGQRYIIGKPLCLADMPGHTFSQTDAANIPKGLPPGLLAEDEVEVLACLLGPEAAKPVIDQLILDRMDGKIPMPE